MVKKEEIKKEDLIQAVVVCDSFNNSFAPLTSSLPSCLLPIAGRPLIEYTLECLSYSGVQDVILYAANNSSKVTDWLNSSRWGTEFGASPFPVTVIVNEQCRSFGDAMRDLYERGVLRNDFILCSGDLVSNLDLAPYLAKHKETFKKDKKAIMTAIYTQGYQGHPLRCKGNELVLATDKQSDQILFYQRSNTKSTNFPVELFQHDEVEVIFDVLDPNVYICGPELLALFSDNFDIQDMDTMINEILESELVDSTIYLQVLNSGFSCRANNPYLFRQVYQKILNRWVYPIVPERNVWQCSAKICLQTNSVYRSSGSAVSKGTVIGKETYIGNSVKLSEGCQIQETSLESNVIIEKNTTVTGSIIMKNTTIGEGCILENCIVGEGVQIPGKCVMKNKVILGHNVVLKPAVTIPENERVASEKASDGFSDDEEKGDEPEGEYGPKAFVYVDEDEEDDEDLDMGGPEDLWGEPFSTSDESGAESEEDSEGDEWDDNFSGEEMDDEEEGGGVHDDVKNFKREVQESLLRADQEGKIVTDNLVLEINSSKHAWNTTLCEVNQCVLESVMILNLDLDLPAQKVLAHVKSNIVKFKGLLDKYSKSKSGEDYYLSAIPDLVKRYPVFMDTMAKILHLLYDADILGENSILSWAQKLQDLTLKKKLKAFLDWLEEDDSSGEEDDSSEEESD